ncbi:YY1-associated factor 2 isoform X2 [Prionailurus viverrinus]|uniref:YY1-associated factor 2 isoform X4 n=1 Tax=Prionailurus bengalensis TaxID=37029 RepID=UPI001CA8DF74|nr:YY1-associated factor 2 isoform X4 [Prionailurus bengalensis]XP_043419345.1 YY1-associated factor 2 isoform X4 [Prionailurus bengalensis]XP_047724475.1 YY1-associated factor 2 isoform X2 [Prionailurus viverrinus]XP_047724476.1 YY1-associated factor 2 isoform X2 [Prionailurus viverrinus]XP_047724477.1 YY1-associated factor 2 isoform X2 [Prionailurus viverrinus]
MTEHPPVRGALQRVAATASQGCGREARRGGGAGGCSDHPHAARPRTRRGCWAALAAFEVSGAAAGWPARVTCTQAGVSPTAGGCVGSGGGSGARRCGLPRPLLPPPPPASARLIILLIDKQSGRGGDSPRASVAKPWETRRAPPGRSGSRSRPRMRVTGTVASAPSGTAPRPSSA